MWTLQTYIGRRSWLVIRSWLEDHIYMEEPECSVIKNYVWTPAGFITKFNISIHYYVMRNAHQPIPWSAPPPAMCTSTVHVNTHSHYERWNVDCDVVFMTLRDALVKAKGSRIPLELYRMYCFPPLGIELKQLYDLHSLAEETFNMSTLCVSLCSSISNGSVLVQKDKII